MHLGVSVFKGTIEKMTNSDEIVRHKGYTGLSSYSLLVHSPAQISLIILLFSFENHEPKRIYLIRLNKETPDLVRWCWFIVAESECTNTVRQRQSRGCMVMDESVVMLVVGHFYSEFLYSRLYYQTLHCLYIVKRFVFIASFNLTFTCVLCTNSYDLHIFDGTKMLFKVTDISSSLHMSQIHIYFYPFLTFKTTMCAI